MKNSILILSLLIITTSSFGQNKSQKYSELIQKADSLHKAKAFQKAALTYSAAFIVKGSKTKKRDRYKAACSWALANVVDSSFVELYKIARKNNYKNYGHLLTENDFKALHNDKRWDEVLRIVKNNKEKTELKFNKSLVTTIDAIYIEDQKDRNQLPKIEKQFGITSSEFKKQQQLIHKKDSLNAINVKKLLDKNGWIGSDVVGKQVSHTVLIVILHADLATQVNYLPMIREAVKKGTASKSAFALLEDKVALRQGKRQIYGSQIGKDSETNLYYVSPLIDPENVDKRRAEVGLKPLSEYVSKWQIKWNVEKYKRELPTLEIKENANKK